mgnify:CR=1 FL=1
MGLPYLKVSPLTAGLEVLLINRLCWRRVIYVIFLNVLSAIHILETKQNAIVLIGFLQTGLTNNS